MDCLEFLLDVFDTEENFSLLAESDLVLDLLDEIMEIEDVELVEALENLEDENDFLLLSVIGNEIIVEEYFNEDGDGLIIDNDLVIIQEGALDEEEIEDLICADDILILEVEEDEDVECFECECYENGFNDGYQQALIDVLGSIE